MYKVENSTRMFGLAATTAMASALLSGCATNAAPRADVAAAEAQEAIAEGRHDSAVRHAEAAVAGDPRNASYRAMLGRAYLDAGRFASAQSSFDDAMTLGDNSPRTALSLALSLTAQAKYSEAAALLSDWEGEIATADLGLAFALAGEPERGIHLMSNAIRGGENTVKMRQNLAYAYAVAGRWREARTMVAQDVPADQVGARMEQWAAMTSPIAYQQRVASLLGVPASVSDQGQPVELALADNPGIEQLASEASALASAEAQASTPKLASIETVAIPASAAELPAVGKPSIGVENYPAPRTERPAQLIQTSATAAPAGGSLAPVSQDALRFVREPVVQTAPLRSIAEPSSREGRMIASRAISSSRNPAPQAAAAGTVSSSSHLVQLGSFNSEQGARRAWGIYVSRYPELADHEMVITQAVVRGKNYWRVSAGGFSKQASKAMCAGNGANAGEGCIAWAEGSPLPGAVDRGVMLASR